MTNIDNQVVMKEEDIKTEEKKSVGIQDCPVTFTMSKIGGKWKPIILFLISKGANRFGIASGVVK